MPLIESFAEALQITYENGARMLGSAAEPFVVTQAVEAHRWFWKPEKVRILLIAESHVFTSSDEVGIEVSDSVGGNDFPPEIPKEFVRLVYCLGYGERKLLDSPATGRNTGTWQYWDLFGALAGGGKQPRCGLSDLSSRVQWKLNVLCVLKERGIWLIDGSVHAIYSPGGQRLAKGITDSLHKQWLSGYGGALLAEADPKYTFVIGKTLSRTLTDFGVRFDNWIYQPNCRGISPTVAADRMQCIHAALSETSLHC